MSDDSKSNSSTDLAALPASDSSEKLIPHSQQQMLDNRNSKIENMFLASASQLANSLSSEELQSLKTVDSQTISALTELMKTQEGYVDAEHKRKLEIIKLEHQHTLDLEKMREEQKEKERKLSLEEKETEGKLSGEKIQLWFRLGFSLLAFIVGAWFVISGITDMGFFLLGGGLSVVSSSAVDIMRSVRSQKNDE